MPYLSCSHYTAPLAECWEYERLLRHAVQQQHHPSMKADIVCAAVHEVTKLAQCLRLSGMHRVLQVTHKQASPRGGSQPATPKAKKPLSPKARVGVHNSGCHVDPCCLLNASSFSQY